MRTTNVGIRHTKSVKAAGRPGSFKWEYHALRLDLLKRAVAAGRADHFQLRDLCPRDATLFENSFEWLIENEFVERVNEGCGKWYYRLTGTGTSAVAAGKRLREVHARLPERVYEGISLGRLDGRRGGPYAG